MSDPSGFRTCTTKPNISETPYKGDHPTSFFFFSFLHSMRTILVAIEEEGAQPT
jgi:hypothetical protein